MVELGRGCSRGCRFCAAGFIYRPPRLWPAESCAAWKPRPEGVDRIGLLGMEMAAPETVDRMPPMLAAGSCSLSFSSLRADRITDQTLALLAASRLKSVAIAADGCSARLRRLINKGLDEPELLDAAERLVASGIFHLKLYVMIGLPTETTADLDELVRLVDRLQARILPLGRSRGRVSVLTLSINCFVPKPWTPFQYCSFGGLGGSAPRAKGRRALAALKERSATCAARSAPGPTCASSSTIPDQALQQAVYSRADRRIGPACSTSAPAGHRSPGRWPRSRCLAVRGSTAQPGELLCWEVVDHGIRGHYLLRRVRPGPARRRHPAV